jgi:hypothetical protein
MSDINSCRLGDSMVNQMVTLKQERYVYSSCSLLRPLAVCARVLSFDPDVDSKFLERSNNHLDELESDYDTHFSYILSMGVRSH